VNSFSNNKATALIFVALSFIIFSNLFILFLISAILTDIVWFLPFIIFFQAVFRALLSDLKLLIFLFLSMEGVFINYL